MAESGLPDWEKIKSKRSARESGLLNDLAAKDAEIERLQDALIQAEGKARLGAQVMQPDERGQHIADGFTVIADYCRDAVVRK